MYTTDSDNSPLPDSFVSAPAIDFQERLDADIVAAGGELVPDTIRDGSIGATMFDLPNSEDGSLTVLLPRVVRIHLSTGSWVGGKPVAHAPPKGACTADYGTTPMVVAMRTWTRNAAAAPNHTWCGLPLVAMTRLANIVLSGSSPMKITGNTASVTRGRTGPVSSLRSHAPTIAPRRRT